MRRHRATLSAEGRLSENQIRKLIRSHEDELPGLIALHDYYRGKNPGIMTKTLDENQNRIPVPYGRLLVRIVVGFMYKSGLITYEPNSPAQKGYFEALEELFKENREPELNTELGKDQTIFGEAYELHYVDNDEAKDQFARIPVYEFIPVYNYDIKPKLIAGIRYFKIDEKVSVEIYYESVVVKYTMQGSKLTETGTEAHPYEQVPVVVYRNNEDLQGDLEHVQKLIDAYDILISTFLDDEEKFAEAILLLYGKMIDAETVDKLQRLRVIDNLKEGEKIEYLTKDLSVSGRRELLEIVRQEIHRQSLIPDMTEPSALGQKSGEAFIYLFALFELLAGEKQSYFAQGLRKRIQLVTQVMNHPKAESIGDPNDIKITFTRNLPKNLSMLADVVSKLWGMASEKTLLGMLPFIENPDDELKQKEKEAESNQDPTNLKTPEDILKVYSDKFQDEKKGA